MARPRFATTRRAATPGLHKGLFRRVFDGVLAIAILGLLMLVAARLDRLETRTTQGLAVVNDGDTLTLGQERIRLRGIDAPEYNQTCLRDGSPYACGRQAREALVGLIARRPVSCSGWERDRYGRLLGRCMAGNVDLNGSLVAAGWAVAYGDYKDEEDAARAKGVGLWAGSFDRPRDWRDRHGGMADTDPEYFGKALNWLRAVCCFS